MRDRLGIILKFASYALAAVLVLQLAGIVLRINPLARVTVPELPSLPGSVQPAAAAHGTNAGSSMAQPDKGSNNPARLAGTNSTAPGLDRTNSPSPVLAASNSVSSVLVVSADAKSNAPMEISSKSSNVVVSIPAEHGTNLSPVVLAALSNGPAMRTAVGSNTSAAHRDMAAMPPGMAVRGMPEPSKLPSLPAEIQARVSRITDSEILGSIVRPLPMALLGIAGEFAFLRATNGQTGLVKEGDDLAGMKLLRIGTNRVLVELEGQKKELTIFSGFGGESLLPEPENHP